MQSLREQLLFVPLLFLCFYQVFFFFFFRTCCGKFKEGEKFSGGPNRIGVTPLKGHCDQVFLPAQIYQWQDGAAWGTNKTALGGNAGATEESSLALVDFSSCTAKVEAFRPRDATLAPSF